jgi:phosphomannomutase
MMAAKPIQFGTDGWRGHIADNYTFEAVRRCSHGFAEYIKAQDPEDLSIVIGYDKRFAGDEFAKTAAEVMAAHGFHVFLTDGPTPTPTISYAAVAKKALGAINITASHNPPGDNGFKVRDENGGAVDPAGLRQIEANIPASDEDIPRIDFLAGQEAGSIEVFDPRPAYVAQIERLIDLEPLRKAGLKILIDPMWGNGAGWFSDLLSGG